MNPQQIVKCCDKIVEIGIYGLAFLIPLYFDIHLHSTFDLSKVGLMYIMTLLMLTAWFIKMALTGNLRSVVTPLTIPIFAFWASYIISTVFSINPITSLIGTYKRYQGLCAITSYIIQFFLVVNFIDTTGKLYRLLRAFLYAGVVSGIYGAIQHFGYDPITWEGWHPHRVVSTLGNPVFFGGYVLMAFMVGLGMYLRVEGGSTQGHLPSLVKMPKKKKKEIKAKHPVSSWNLKDTFWAILYVTSIAIAGLSFLGLRLSHPRLTTFLVFTLLIVASIPFFRIPQNFSYGPLVYGASVALMYYGFSITVTRGAYIGMALGILFFLIVLGYRGLAKNRRRLILLGVVIFVIFFNHNVINEETSVIKRFIELFPSPKPKEIGLIEGLHIKGVALYENFSPPYPRLQTVDHEVESKEGFLPNISIHRIKERLLDYDPSKISRLFIWWSVVEALLDKERYLWLGIGPDTMEFIFLRYFYRILPQEMKGSVVLQNRAHNNILDILLATGIIGLGIYSWLLFTFFLTGIRYLKKVEDKEKVILVGLMAAVVGFLGQNLVSFETTPLSLSFWLLLGATMVGGKLLSNSPKPVVQAAPPLRFRKRLTLPLCLVMIMIVGFLGYLILRVYLADGYCRRGAVYMAGKDLDGAIAMFEEAVRLHPYEVKYRGVCNQLYIKKALNTSYPQWANKAIKGAKDLLVLAPDQNSAYFTLAIAYYLSGDIKEAVDNYKKAVELNPFLAHTYINVGMILTQEEKLDRIFKALKTLNSKQQI